MQVINHKVYLYKPDGSSSSFLGELIVDNLKVDLKLQDISSISFRIPEVINGEVNPRIDEVLDSYIVELWYGRIDGVYENGDFEKVRFRIYSTPLEFAEYKYLHSYSGYSIESDLEFKQIVSWPGIEVKDFFRTLKYNNNASTPAFTEPGFSYTVLLSTNTSQTKYIKILPTDQPSALDIFIYEKRINTADDSESETSLIELTSGGVNSNDFKAGYYYLTTFNGIVTEIYIAIPDNVTLFNGQNTSTRIFSYRLYDNPVSRKFAVGVKTNTEEPLSNMYIDLAQDAATGDDTPEYGGYTFNTQATYSKNGLKLQEILQGIDNEEDGILYNTGFTVGTISNTIAAKYRSNIDFNNITTYQAIKEVAESFDAIAVFNTTNKTVSFYAENEFGTNSGLFIKYATYLKSINKEIDAAKIITNARATGKDNIKISLLNPTGSEVWEDYSYFLDGFLITDTEGFTINQNIDIGLSITYPTTTGLQSRWMDATEALKIAKWQFTRDYFHGVLSDKDADVYGILHEPFRGLYEERSKLINLYVKYETQYERKKASEYKFYYLSEHYKNLYQSRGTNLNEYQYYLAKYNESKQQAQDFKNTVLNVTYNNLYNEEQNGTVAFRLAAVRDYLDKDAWAIDLEKLRTFQRETTHNDSKIDNEYDLLTATKIFVDENKQPRITFNISIIDVLEAAEAYQDWDKFNVGDKIYIFFPEFNIDLEAQIREVSIDFQGKSLSIVVSTVRNYNRSFGNFLTKSIRRFHNANMNTLMYYKDANEVTIQDTNNFRTTFEDGINAGDTSVSTGAVDDSTGESSTTTDGEGQKSKIVTGVDIYTEALTLSEFTTGVKITDGRVLTFKPYDVGGEQWVQEVEISADNGFVIRQVFSDGPTIDVRRLAYIDSDDGSAYFAGWKLDPGQFRSGTESNFVAINSQPVGTNPYAFWSGDLVPSLAPFSIKKDGTIIAEKGLIAGLTIAKDLVNPNLIKFYAGDGNFYNTNTPFYLDNGGNFSLSNKLKFDISTQVLTVNGTIVATSGSIGGWTIEENQLSSGANNTYVAINANTLSDYAFWAGNSNPVNAPFSITKVGAIKATSGTISGLTIGTGTYVDPDTSISYSKNAIFTGTGVWGADLTPFYLDEDGRFSLSNELTWDPDTNTFFVNGTIQATIGEIGGWTVETDNLNSNGMKLYSGSSPYISIDQTTVGYSEDGIFLGIDSSNPKFSLVGSTSALEFDGNSLSITGGSLTVGTNGVGTGSIVIDGNGVRGFYGGILDENDDPIPTFKLSNSTGLLEAVNIFLQAENKTAEIGNLTSSLAGDFGFEITNNGGYYLNKTDISFTAATKTISSTTTNLSVYKKGNKIVVAGSLNNNNTFTAAENGTTTSLEVEETLVDEAAGTTLTIARSQPYKVSMTDEGFFVLSVDALNTADTAMSVRYYSNRIWAKRLLIADVEDEEGATVVIGTIAGNASLGTNSTYGIITKSGDNTVYMTGEGFKIVQDGDETFKVQADGTITAETLVIRGDSTLGGWTVSDDYFQSNNYAYTSENFSTAGIKFNNDGTIIGKQFAINSNGDAFFRGDLSAASGTFGATNAGHVILGNENNPLQVKNNNTTILNLTNTGVLTFAGFTATNSRLTAGATGEAVGVGPSMGNNVSFYAGAAVDSPALLPTTEQIDAAPFRVTKTGILNASGATISGTITANSGSIGGWTINSDGIFTGTFDESAYTTSGITISNNGSIHSPNFYLDSTGITTKAGNIGGFTIGATSLTAGATTTSVGVTTDSIAFYAGNATPGSAPFRVTNEGVLTATSGKIANWTLGNTSLTAGTGGSSVGVTTDTIAFYAGNATPGSAPFRVENNGALTATSADITGAIKASSGQIGSNANNKWIIGTDTTDASIYNGKTTFADSTNAGIYIGTNGISLGTAGVAPQFSVTNLGVLTASSGTVGGFTLSSTALTAGTSSGNYLGMSPGAGSGSNISFWAGAVDNTAANISAAPFRIFRDGTLIATRGAIGGFTIDANALRSGTSGTAVGISPNYSNTTSTNVSFYAGAETTSSNAPTSAQVLAAPFRVLNDGTTTVRFINFDTQSVVTAGVPDISSLFNGFGSFRYARVLARNAGGTPTNTLRVQMGTFTSIIGSAGLVGFTSFANGRGVAIGVQDNLTSTTGELYVSGSGGSVTIKDKELNFNDNANTFTQTFASSTGTIGVFQSSASANQNIQFRVGRISSFSPVVPTDGRRTITYTPAFPTGLTYGVIITPVGTANMGLSGSVYDFGVESPTNANFVFVNDGQAASVVNGFSYIAFAY